MRKPALLLTLIALSLSACAKKKDDTQFESPVFKNPTENLSEAQRQAANPVVTCIDAGGKCEPAVGMLTVATDDHSGACTATLVSEDVAVTNSHCIPDDLKMRGANCTNRMWLSFPSYPGRPDFDNRVGCREVLQTSELDLWSDEVKPDFAFIRLEHPVNRPPVPLDRAGFRDGETVEITVVDPYLIANSSGRPDAGATISGVMHTNRCETVFGTSLLPKGNDRLSDILVFGNCPIIKGNSGSAIRSEGKVRGVIQAFFNPAGMREKLEEKGIELLDGKIAEINVGTNLACQRMPLGPALPDSCFGRDPFEAEDRLAETQATRLEAQFQEKLASVVKLKEIDWTAELSTDTGKVLITPEPRCVRLDSPSFKKDLVAIPRFELKSGVDKYLREMRRVVGPTGIAHASLAISLLPGEERKYQVTLGKAFFQNVNTYAYPELTRELGACAL